MVLVKNLSTTVINSLPNYGGEILYNTTANRPIVNTADGFKYFVLSTLSGDVTGLASLSATNLTGTLQTAAQPNVTSLGTLTGLTSSGNINFSSHDGSTAGLSLGGVLVTATAAELNYVDTTPGTAQANKALVTDSNNSIVGLTNLETDNLTVNGTLVTASAIELNYTDVTTIGIAQASKALVLDANLDIVGIHNIETDNLTVNGTLVTASAVELNYTDVSTIGTADPGKALVTDLNKDIGGIRNLSAENLTGTLQTAAQPNVTSVGTLTSLNVSGATTLSSLTVGGVSFTPYGESGVRARVYSTVDFNGRLIYNNVVNNVDFTDFVPSGQASGYSMEVWGYIKPAYTENYTFTITSNDQFRIWINNNLVRTGWTSGDHNNIQTDPIALTANVWYPIYIQHVQETSTERLNIKWESTSQIVQTIPQANFAFDNKDIDVSMRNSHFQDSIKFYDSTNSNVSSVGVTTSGVLTLSPYSNNVNLPGHDGSTTGLHLAGTLVTATATELNYTDVTTIGTAQASKALVVDANKDIGSIRNVRTIGNFGINTTSADKQAEINSSTGDCLRLTYNDNNGSAANYSDFLVSNTGDLTLTPSGANLNISSALAVTGATTLSSTLGVTGASTLSSTLGVTGATTLSSTLGVTGATTLSSTLDVTGVINFNNVTDATSYTSGGCLTIDGGAAIAKKLFVGTDLDVGGNSVFTGTMGVTGATSLSSTLGVTGATTLSSTLGVTGATTLSSTLGVTGATTLSSTLGVTGATTLSDTLGVTGATTLSNTTDATSSTVGGSLTVAGGAGIAKKLFVGTDFAVGGNSTLTGTLGVTGATTLSSTLGVTGATTLSSTLGVTGATTLSDTLDVTGVSNLNNTTDATSSTAGGSLTVDGGAGIAKKLFVGTDLAVGGNSSLTGTLGVTGATTLSSTLGVSGATTLSSTLGVTGATTLSSTLGVTGASTLSSTLGVSGATTLSDTLDVTGVTNLNNTTDATSSTAGGSLTVDGGAGIAKKLFVGTDFAVGGNSTLTGTLGVTGASTLSSTLGVTGATTLSDTLDVTGVTNLNNTTDATSSTAGGSLTVDGGAGIAKKLFVGTDLAVGGNSSLTGTLGVTGASTLSSTLDVTGATTLSSTLDVTGVTNLNNTTDATSSTAGGSLTVDGGAGIAKKLFVGTDFAVGGNSTLTGTLGVTGASTLSSTLGVTGATTLSDTLGVTGATTLSSTLDVTGAATFSSTLGITGALTLNNTTDATSSTVGGCLTVAGGAGIAKKLFVGTDFAVGGNSTLSGNLSITGPILSIPTGNTSARPATPQVGYIRYNSETSQFEGYGAGNAWGSLGGVSDVDQNTKILAEDGAGTNDNNLRFFNDGNESMRLTAASKLGVGTTAPSKQVEINAAAGDVLRLTRNNNTGTATNYSDFSISSSGNLNILSSGLTTTIDETNNFDIVGHNGSTLGLKLNGTLVTSTATQLNYNNVTPGTAAATKALILDSSRNIANINSITTNNVNFTIDNATANNVGYPINLIRTTSGTPANGLGIGLDFFIENAANNNIEFGTIEVSADDITTGSEDGLLTVKLMNGGTSSAALTLTHTYLTVTELVETSDRRVKENIVSVNNEDSFNKIMDLNIVDYNFIADSEKKTHRGLIAQELAEVIPSAINISERNGIEDFHAVSSKELVGYLISSLQHMNTKFEELNSKYEELKNGMCRCNQ
jgi:hypothetical protein